MIVFIVQCYLASSQILMLDSRQEFTQGLKLNLFQKRFSTWVTYFKNPQVTEIGFFKIINSNYKVMEICGFSNHLRISYNQNQVFELYDEQLLNNQWIHLIIDQQITSQNDVLKIETPLNQKDYKFKIDSATNFQSQSFISLIQDDFMFCLIYDRESIEVKPIIYSIDLQKFITNRVIYLSSYHSDSAIEIFLKKNKKYKKNGTLLDIRTSLDQKINVLHKDNQIQIIENEIVRFVDSSSRQYSWFKLLFQFDCQSIQYEIQFADEKISQSINEITQPFIKMIITLYLYLSSFQFMKVTTYFKTRNYEQFESQQLQTFMNCDQNIRYYLDIQSNTCRDYLDLDQIQIIERNGNFQDYFDTLHSQFSNSQLIGETVARQVLSNLTNDDRYPFVNYHEQEMQNFFIEPFLLFQFGPYQFCHQNYFGQNCKIFIKKCSKAQQNYCNNCIEGHLLIMNRCIKCPQNCLICILHQKQQKCLLPKANYFLNKNYLIKLCEYEYCSNMGQQISNQQMMSKIEECFNNLKCLLKHCKQLHSYQRLDTQECYSPSKENLQIIYYYLSFQVRQVQFGQELLQFMLIQSFELYGNILMNKMISNYYLNVQMESYINKELKMMDFILGEYYYQNIWNFECAAKAYFSERNATCIKYNKNKNKNKKCHNVPCIYKLEIRDILYYLGPQNYVALNDFFYSSLMELLQSVQLLSLKFEKVYLKINLIVYDYTYEDLKLDIDFNDRRIIPQFLNSSIEIEIKFNQQQTLYQGEFNIKIYANKIIIQDQSIANYLNLYLVADIIEIKRLNLEKHSIFIIKKGNTAIFDQIEVHRNFYLNISYFRTAEIKNFFLLNDSCFISILFQNIKVDIYNFTYFTKQQCGGRFFQFDLIAIILVEQLEFGFDQINQFNLIHAQRIEYIQIKDTSLVAERLVDSKLFFSREIKMIELINSFFNITRLYNGTIFDCYFTRQTNIEQFSLISKWIEQSPILRIFVDENITLIKIKIKMDFYSALSLIQTMSHNLEIIGLNILQNFKADHNEKTFPISGYLLDHTCSFYNITSIDIQGINLKGHALLFLHSLNYGEITRCIIRNITIEFQNTFFSLIGGMVLNIYYFQISDFRIQSQSLDQINLIEFSSQMEINIIECYVLNIQTTSELNQNYIFDIDSLDTRLIRFLIVDCKYINLFQIQSQNTLISQIAYHNNTFQSIIQLKGMNPKLLKLEHSILKILDQREILTYFSTQKVTISLFYISIVLKHVYQYFVLSGRHEIILRDVYIRQQTLENLSNYSYGIFKLQQSNLVVRRMNVFNLNQILFQILDSQMIQIQDLLLSNAEIQSTKCLFYIYETPLLLEYISLINIRNLEHIFYIEANKRIIIRKVLVYETKNVFNIFQIKSNTSQELILFEDIIFVNIFEAWLFHFGFNEKQKIKIDNLFINRSDKFLYSSKSNYIFILNKSIMRVVNFKIDSSLFILSQSEIFYNYLLKLPDTHFDRSFIFNNVKQSILKEKKLSMTLSFNGVNLLKTIHLDKLEENNIQKILITQTGQMKYFFYVPSGQYISAFKQFNFASLQHQQVYQGLYLVVDGFLKGQIEYNMLCIQQQSYNDVNEQEQYKFDIQQGINDLSNYMFIISPLNTNYTVFKITCNSDKDGQMIQLQYNVKAFPCQLGEFLYKNMCKECNINYNQYSFKQNSNKCNYIDQSRIKQIRKGILQLNPRYWRYKYTSDIIEQCDSNYCNGGSFPGDRSCIQSRVGALCEECDLYNVRGDGQYTKSDQYCMECEGVNFILILKLLFSILWQLLLIVNGYYSNKKLSEQYLMFRIGFRQYYQILYRQSIDIPSIIIKMLINYVFLLFIIKSNLNLIGYAFINNINIINNPSLITKAQIDCILSRVLQMDIIYSSFIFQIVLLFFIVTLAYVLYFFIICVKKIRFHLGLILFVTEGIIVYNLNVILNISLNLLSYKVASGLKWVKYNIQYLFITETHMSMIQFIVPVTTLLIILPLLFPIGIKSLSVFNRQVKRIYALYYQEYNPSYVFWDYFILYTKYTIMIFSTSDTFSKQYGIIIIFIVLMLIFNLKPYHLQNLNLLEYNLYFAYGIQLSLLSIDKFKDEIIVLLNLIIISKFAKIIYQAYSNFNRRRILSWKLKVISKILWAGRILGIQKDQRQLKNRQDFIYLINTKILKKSQLAPTVNHALFQTEQEIEMPMIFKQVQQGAPQTRKEEILN